MPAGAAGSELLRPEQVSDDPGLSPARKAEKFYQGPML
jgi:hypothetical protein